MNALDLLAIIFIPASIAAGIGLAWQGLAPRSARYSLAVALAVGVAAGCWLFPNPVPLQPTSSWHWLPYLGLLAAAAGSLVAAAQWSRRERLVWDSLQFLLLGVAAAALLVPTWTDWKEVRPQGILLLSLYLAALTTGLVCLPERLRGRGFIFPLMLAASGAAPLNIYEVSLRMGEVSLRVATALGGCWAASWLFRLTADEEASPWQLVTAALAPVYVILCGGSSFVAAVELETPKYFLLLAPAAPLTLWFFAWGPLGRLKGFVAFVLQCVVVLIIPAILLAISLLNSSAE